MLKQIDNNEVQSVKFSKPLSDFTSSTEFIVKGLKENFRYDNQNKRTDECIGFTLRCIDPDNYDVLNIKIPKCISLTSEEVNKSDKEIYLIIPTDETTVYPWKVEYGKAQVTIEAPTASIVKE